jgi:hypothetical protein
MLSHLWLGNKYAIIYMVFAEKKSTLDKGRIESMNIIQQLLTQLPKNNSTLIYMDF